MIAALARIPDPRRTRGVTLIELLVALVIVATLTAAVTLAIPDFGARRSDAAAEQLAARIGLACERAMVSGRDVGIRVAVDGLRFGQFEAGAFQPWVDDPSEPLRPRTLSHGLQLQLMRDGRVLEFDDNVAPQLACQASGELTPFELLLLRDALPLWRIRGLASGSVEREQVAQ